MTTPRTTTPDRHAQLAKAGVAAYRAPDGTVALIVAHPDGSEWAGMPVATPISPDDARVLAAHLLDLIHDTPPEI